MAAASATKINPFTAQDLAIARQIVDSARVLRDFYSRCANCGLDVTALQAQVDSLEQFAESVVREFGDGEPAAK